MLQLRHFLSRHLADFRPHHEYTLSQMVLALIYPMILGLDRLESASFLRSDETFQYLTGLPSYLDPQSLRRFLLQAWEPVYTNPPIIGTIDFFDAAISNRPASFYRASEAEVADSRRCPPPPWWS